MQLVRRRLFGEAQEEVFDILVTPYRYCAIVARQNRHMCQPDALSLFAERLSVAIMVGRQIERADANADDGVLQTAMVEMTVQRVDLTVAEMDLLGL